jgi:hypothetical protein
MFPDDRSRPTEDPPVPPADWRDPRDPRTVARLGDGHLVRRMPVPGGWLYVVFAHGGRESSCAFVPDAAAPSPHEVP